MIILTINKNDGTTQRTQRKVENHTQAFAEYQELVNAGFTVDICVNIEKGDK
tara:strand:- start:1870 stop:2025 length:156 start_codon:yes stop_codon:yes gene_type:complete